jgi:hypothetical protein
MDPFDHQPEAPVFQDQVPAVGREPVAGHHRAVRVGKAVGLPPVGELALGALALGLRVDPGARAFVSIVN